MAYKSPFSGMFAAADATQADGDSSSPSSSGSYKSSFTGMFGKRKKREEEQQAAQLEASMKVKADTKKAEEKKNSEKSVAQRAGDVTKGVGNFLHDAYFDVKDTTVNTWQGAGNIARGQLAQRDMAEKTKVQEERQKQFKVQFGNAPDEKWKDPAFVAEAKKFTDETKRLASVSDNTRQDIEAENKIDAKKLAFQSAETALNVGTLGITTIPKQLAEQGIKIGAKAALKQAIKVGGADLLEQTLKHGGETLTKKAAQEVLERGGKSTLKKLAGTSGKAALEGSAYGVTQTGKNSNEDTKLDDYILNAAFGAGIGAALPIAGAGLKKGTQKAVKAIKGEPGAKVAAKVIDPDDVNGLMNQAIDEQSGKYGTNILTRAKNWVGDQVNPYRALAKIDDAYAKMTGKKRHLLEAGENLEDLARRSAVSEREASSLFFKELDVPAEDGSTFKSSAADLVKKYKGDSPEGMEFNNYTNAKFDLEFRAKKPGQRIQKGFEDDQLQKFVDDYEARNPDALKDIAIKKRVNDEAVDYMERAGAISKEEAAQIKSAYKYAVPLERIFPDDLARPEMTGKNVGSIAKQTVIQRLEGGSDIPLSNSFDTMLNRVGKAVSQGNRAKLAQKLLERSEQGLINGSKVLVEAGNKTARKTLREQAQLISKGVRHLNKKLSMSNRQVKRLDKELSKLNIEGMQASIKGAGMDAPKPQPVKTVTVKTVHEQIIDNAPKTLDDLKQTYDIKAALLKEYGPGEKGIQQMAADIYNGGWEQLMKLNPNISKSTAKSIASQILKKPTVKGAKTTVTEGTIGRKPTARSVIRTMLDAATPEKDVLRIQKKIAKREPKLAAKLDEVLNYKREIDSLKVLKTELKEVTAEFTDDPTTGKQVISGIIDGEPYKMEVPPEIAKAVQGLDSKKVEGILKAFAIIKKPFEVTWTGVFNPVFATVSFLAYDAPMSVINSPQGRKVFSAKAVVEGFKSFKSSSKFQKALAAEGARPYGGSGASAFTKMDAKAIAAQRNILSNIKYTASHPEVALSKLDVWGGKLANSTRTRIARAEYDAFLKTAKKEGRDIKSPEVQKQAMEQAALAYRTIMPDYDTMSHLTRQINSVVPFYAASVAGTRSFGQAIRRDPRSTLIKAGTVGLLPTVGVTAFSLMQPAGQEFYKDMEASGNTRTLDDNLVVVLPGAHKDDKTGEWVGIVKIPLAPEFRAINQTTWRETRKMMGGDGPSASHVALSLFDTVTGGVRSSENPLVSTRRILSGEDPRTGERIVKGDMANLPKEEQVYEWTSGAGKVVGKLLHTSPIQGDKMLSQFGLVGETAKNGGKPVEAVTQNVSHRVSGAFGEKANEAFFSTYSPLKARRDKASKEVTDLVKAGRRNEARRKADEFNETLRGRFGEFESKYGNSDAKDPAWDDLMSGLIIKKGDASFDARYKQ